MQVAAFQWLLGSLWSGANVSAAADAAREDLDHHAFVPARPPRSLGCLAGDVPANESILALALQALLQGEREIEPGLFQRIELQRAGPDIRAHR
jgi:hypothetical protein